ncbi:DUF4129 domain-containing protein [Cellulomonas sp. KRMCY2]|uniref:DUF4129 domain-containing protein n=1 Tax=Cellulomonas sp. KRMCY2 TaxID=1304865 RepID=UPI0004B8E0A9|nr:DUF4129 domain-containing protein [Cellulomonas sp. KRMCY2]
MLDRLVHVPGALHRVLADVPVDPDAETARRWAHTELADPIYHEQRESLLARAIRWVLEQLAKVGDRASGLDLRTTTLVVVGVLVLGAIVVLVVAGPVRRARRAGRGSVEVFVDDVRSADELRASADAFAARGAWAEAVLDRFRAVLRSLEDRALLDPRPGRTAHEAAGDGGRRLPTCADDLRRAGVLFDDVCYGDAAAAADDDAWLREVDRRVAAARPVSSAAAGRGSDGLAVPR